MILLMGIVKKNSILLVDLPISCAKANLLSQGSSVGRLPGAPASDIYDVGGDDRGRAAGGVRDRTRSREPYPHGRRSDRRGLVSTLLTLFVVPCAYLVFSRLERKPEPRS